MRQFVSNYRNHVSFNSLEEFKENVVAVKAHVLRGYNSPYSLCGDVIRIPVIWGSKGNFNLFHPTFSDFTECLGVTSSYMYYALPSVELSVRWLDGIFAHEDFEFKHLLGSYLCSITGAVCF